MKAKSTMNMQWKIRASIVLQTAAFAALMIVFTLWHEPLSHVRDPGNTQFVLGISPYVIATTVAAVNLLVNLRSPIQLFPVVSAALIAALTLFVSLISHPL